MLPGRVRPVWLALTKSLTASFLTRRASKRKRIPFLLCLLCVNAHATEAICPALQIAGPLEPPLSEAEKRLVCGDSEPAPGGSTAWSLIPPAQARYHLRAFLQTRGYLHPSFVEREYGNILVPGERSRVSRLDARGAPAELRLERKRKVVGEILTPDLLSATEKWAFQRLQAVGFPCPEVKATADPDTTAITLDVGTGQKRTFGGVLNEDVAGMEQGILRRYDAFAPSWDFDGDALNLSENRIVSQGLVQNLHYEVLCDPKKMPSDGTISVREQIIAGPPRLVSVGFGLNTEGAVVIRGNWSNNRLGPKASQLSLSVYGSSREQRADLLGRYYFLPGAARFHLRPLLQYDHRNEVYFETLTFRSHFTPSTSLERPKWGAVFNFGPTLELIRTLRGPGVGDSHFTSLLGEALYRTHDFEYYASNPKSGLSLSGRAALSTQEVISTTSAQRLGLFSESLWNWRDLDPALWIFGIRGGAQTTLTPQRTGSGTLLPAEFLYFLGGSANLRGYGRQELPDSDGALTVAYLNLEARLANEFPYGLEPIVFWDLGWTGKDPLSLQFPAYHSPGIGLRWSSPIGVFRTTLARGLTSTSAVTAHWQFFLSYGEEF